MFLGTKGFSREKGGLHPVVKLQNLKYLFKGKEEYIFTFLLLAFSLFFVL